VVHATERRNATPFSRLAICVFLGAGSLFAQSNVSTSLSEIPKLLQGKYVLISRSALGEGKTEDFKDKPRPFGQIERDYVVLSSGDVLHTTSVAKFVETNSVAYVIRFEGVDYLWYVKQTPSDTLILQSSVPNPNQKAIASFTSLYYTNAFSDTTPNAVTNQIHQTFFRLLKAEGSVSTKTASDPN